MINIKQVIKVRQYKAGYEVRKELIDGTEFGCPDFEIESAYTIPNEYYIGEPKMAYRLCKQRGIKPEPRLPADSEANGGKGRTCTIGFCENEQKWYGWSHRAIYGFGIGDEVDSKDHICSGRLPIGFKAKTLDEAKLMAVTFAEGVN